jgi:hypothetical protein
MKRTTVIAALLRLEFNHGVLDMKSMLPRVRFEMFRQRSSRQFVGMALGQFIKDSLGMVGSPTARS